VQIMGIRRPSFSQTTAILRAICAFAKCLQFQVLRHGGDDAATRMAIPAGNSRQRPLTPTLGVNRDGVRPLAVGLPRGVLGPSARVKRSEDQRVAKGTTKE
jgi:hypothetical protein